MGRGLVVCFSGKIGSGKSSVTVALAERLGWKLAGFGDYLRHRLASEGGDATDRQALQDLGQSLVERDSESFCREVIAHSGHTPGENLLVDGIRHAAIYGRIGQLLAPCETRLIHLGVAETTLVDRVRNRDGAVDDLDRAADHPVERELGATLPTMADAIVDAERPLVDVIKTCLDRIDNWRG